MCFCWLFRFGIVSADAMLLSFVPQPNFFRFKSTIQDSCLHRLRLLLFLLVFSLVFQDLQRWAILFLLVSFFELNTLFIHTPIWRTLNNSHVRFINCLPSLCFCALSTLFFVWLWRFFTWYLLFLPRFLPCYWDCFASAVGHISFSASKEWRCYFQFIFIDSEHYSSFSIYATVS